MKIILFILIILLTATQSVLTKRSSRMQEEILSFQVVRSLVPTLLFGIMTAIRGEWHWITVIYGVVYGGLLSVSMQAGYKALATGPMGLTSTLVTFSFVVPVIFGIAVLHEPLTWIIGIAFIFVVAAILCMGSKNNDKQPNPKWKWYVAATLLANGVGSVVQKMHQTQFPGQYTEEFLVVNSAVCLLVFGVLLLMKQRPVRCKPTVNSIGVGLCSGGITFFTLILAGLEGAALLFPMIAVCTLAAALLNGRLFFKERLTVVQIIGCICGAIAIFLLKLPT